MEVEGEEECIAVTRSVGLVVEMLQRVGLGLEVQLVLHTAGIGKEVVGEHVVGSVRVTLGCRFDAPVEEDLHAKGEWVVVETFIVKEDSVVLEGIGIDNILAMVLHMTVILEAMAAIFWLFALSTPARFVIVLAMLAIVEAMSETTEGIQESVLDMAATVEAMFSMVEAIGFTVEVRDSSLEMTRVDAILAMVETMLTMVDCTDRGEEAIMKLRCRHALLQQCGNHWKTRAACCPEIRI